MCQPFCDIDTFTRDGCNEQLHLLEKNGILVRQPIVVSEEYIHVGFKE